MQYRNQLKIKFLAVFIIISVGLSSSIYNIYLTRTPHIEVKR